MVDGAGGLIAIAVLLLLCAVPVALSLRPRPVQSVLTTASAGGSRGLAIHPCRGQGALRVLGWVFVGALLIAGAWYLSSSLYAATLFLAPGAYLAYAGWAQATGRAGDGTVTLTPQGIHQLWGSSEVLVPWDDVRGLVTTPKELIVETRRHVRPRRTLPLLGGRRTIEQAEAVSLPYAFLPALPYQEMIELYATSPASRAELGTDEMLERTRRLLTEKRAGPPSPSP